MNLKDFLIVYFIIYSFVFFVFFKSLYKYWKTSERNVWPVFSISYRTLWILSYLMFMVATRKSIRLLNNWINLLFSNILVLRKLGKLQLWIRLILAFIDGLHILLGRLWLLQTELVAHVKLILKETRFREAGKRWLNHS